MVSTPNAKELPIRIVGSSIFGRHPIISDERTWNMFISDDWLLNFAGYEQAVEFISGAAEGRGLFHSTRGNFLISVINNIVYRINPNLGFSPLFQITSSTGEVFIDENLSSQICIVDGLNAYIYNYTTGDVGLVNFVNTGRGVPFVPSYITYQNTYFIFGNAANDTSGSQWFVYQSGFNPTSLANPLQLNWVQTLTLQTKPDYARACIRIPSHGNNLLVLGSTVGEIWTNVGGLQVYQRQSSVNIDYGVASVSTIAASDDMIVWLGINEKSSAAIMYMKGGQAQQLSTDGIDFLLSTVKFPAESTAMFYRQDGHVFYILTFFNPVDDFSIMYDFRTQKFFDVTDWDFTYHPARQMSFFNNEIYFISVKSGSLMRMDSTITDITLGDKLVYEIPRIRKTNTIRFPGSEKFIANRLAFTIENGTEPNVTGEIGAGTQVYSPRIDVNMSKNGGHTYGNSVPYFMHKTGDYKNQPRFNKLGEANQIGFQFRFWGFGAVTVADAVLEVYQ